MDSLKDMNKTTRELTAELSRINNELESLTEQIQNEQQNLRGSLSCSHFSLCFTGGMDFISGIGPFPTLSLPAAQKSAK